jgi:phosphatidylserine/phosphatidylglycerophosphate/cardiolipin synthase-like enzyme
MTLTSGDRVTTLATICSVRRLAVFAALTVFVGVVSVPAAAQERMYWPALENVSQILVQRINAEKTRVDISAWYLSDRTISNALINRMKAGVQVRLIGDRGSIFEIDQHTRNEFYYLANQGVPIRLRVSPKSYPEIVHWKATIFVGQNLVAFGSANYTPYELQPASSTNYKDEMVLLTNDPALVNAFKTQFDRMWNDTTAEPRSRVASPPYFKNWNDACAMESACADYEVKYPNPAPMNINTARLEPDYPMPADMIWGQGSIFNNRLVTEITNEVNYVDFVIYRLTVAGITDALLAKHKAGVPVRIIMEPNEYRNKKWPEFWLTHAYMDKLWAAGVPIKKRTHQGLTHMKMLVTSKWATNASSNLASEWQRDHNYFVSSGLKPTLHSAMKSRFNAMWTNTTAFANFVPEPADAPVLSVPASGATNVPTTTALTWNRAAFATSYDVYLGTSSSSMAKVANVPAALVNNPPATYSWKPATALQPGVTYYFRVASRTHANLLTTSLTRSFTTATSGGTPPPPPPPTGASEIVLYASNVGTLSGAWSKVSDSTAAAGTTLRNVDAGAAALSAPLASPTNFVEATFNAVAGVRYRLWLRMRAKDNSKWNDSVFVQFSGAVNSGGSPIYRIGTTAGLVVNQWTCADCQSIGWGWQNRGYWLNDTGDVWFQTTGTQKIRIQVREDGTDIDQIILSPSKYLNSAPGPASNDTTIVAKQ